MPQMDRVTGPLSREELRALAQAPFGEAAKVIRKFDPLFGRTEGEKFEWEVTCEGDLRGTAYVMAATQEEADELADKLDCAEIDWSDYGVGHTVISVEPKKL